MERAKPAICEDYDSDDDIVVPGTGKTAKLAVKKSSSPTNNQEKSTVTPASVPPRDLFVDDEGYDSNADRTFVRYARAANAATKIPPLTINDTPKSRSTRSDTTSDSGFASTTDEKLNSNTKATKLNSGKGSGIRKKNAFNGIRDPPGSLTSSGRDRSQSTDGSEVSKMRSRHDDSGRPRMSANDSIRLQVDGSGALEFSGDMEGRTINIHPNRSGQPVEIAIETSTAPREVVYSGSRTGKTTRNTVTGVLDSQNPAMNPTYSIRRPRSIYELPSPIVTYGASPTTAAPCAGCRDPNCPWAIGILPGRGDLGSTTQDRVAITLAQARPRPSSRLRVLSHSEGRPETYYHHTPPPIAGPPPERKDLEPIEQDEVTLTPAKTRPRASSRSRTLSYSGSRPESYYHYNIPPIPGPPPSLSAYSNLSGGYSEAVPPKNGRQSHSSASSKHLPEEVSPGFGSHPRPPATPRTTSIPRLAEPIGQNFRNLKNPIYDTNEKEPTHMFMPPPSSIASPPGSPQQQKYSEPAELNDYYPTVPSTQRYLQKGYVTRGPVLPRHADPAANPGMVPWSRVQSDQTRSLRLAIIHLLAIRPTTESEIIRKTGGTKEDVSAIFFRVAIPDREDKSKWQLLEKAYKQLDVWNYNYLSQNDRQKAIDHAVRAYDRLRLASSDPLWQKLLPEEERNKGKILSRLHISLESADRLNSKPKLVSEAAGEAINRSNSAQASNHSTESSVNNEDGGTRHDVDLHVSRNKWSNVPTSELPSERVISRNLPCCFYFLNCHLQFSDFEEWKAHCLSHFRSAKLPTIVQCPYCDSLTSQRFASGSAAWAARLHCIATHNLDGYGTEHARPDFGLFKYLWQHKIVDDVEFQKLMTNHTIARMDLSNGADVEMDHDSKPQTWITSSALEWTNTNTNVNPETDQISDSNESIPYRTLSRTDVDSDIDSDSDKASVFSVLSTSSSVSSITSVADVPLSDMVAKMLFEDSTLRYWSIDAVQNLAVGAARFERNFRRLLKTMALDFQQEAKNDDHRLVALFFRKHSRQIARTVSEKVAACIDNQLVDKKRSENDSGSDESRASGSEAEAKAEAPAEVKGTDEVCLKKLSFFPKDDHREISQEELFRMWDHLASTQAFAGLRSGLQDFANPPFAVRLRKALQPGARKEHFHPDSKAFGALRHTRSPDSRKDAWNSGTSHKEMIPSAVLDQMIADLQYIDPKQIEVRRIEDNRISNRVKMYTERLTGTRWDWWPFKPCMRLLKAKETRLCWNCVSDSGANGWQNSTRTARLQTASIPSQEGLIWGPFRHVDFLS